MSTLQARAKTRTRTVLGVVLTRTGPDTWSAEGGWSFQRAEGQGMDGRQEWWCYGPGDSFTCHHSLRSCVQEMKRETKA